MSHNKLLGLLADREFIGEAWLAWLKTENIDFHIRIKKDAKVPNSRGKPVQAKQLFLFLKAGEALILPTAKIDLIFVMYRDLKYVTYLRKSI